MKSILVHLLTLISIALSQTIDFASPSLLNGPFRVSPSVGIYLNGDSPELRQNSLISFSTWQVAFEMVFYLPEDRSQAFYLFSRQVLQTEIFSLGVNSYGYFTLNLRLQNMG